MIDGLIRSSYSMAQQAIDLTPIPGNRLFAYWTQRRRRLGARLLPPNGSAAVPVCNTSPSFTWTQVNKRRVIQPLDFQCVIVIEVKTSA